MKVLLLQLDGKLPNIALMRIAAHHRALRDQVELRFAGNEQALNPHIWDAPDLVYASCIFTRTKPLAKRLLTIYPDAFIGGTGWDLILKLEDYNITTLEQDYSIYPRFMDSIGFSQRGCRLRCSFCVVPLKEGAIREEKTINQIWRGEPYPHNILLLDNDFFGQLNWQARIEEIRSGGFKVCFSQGINARMLTEEAAEAIGSIKYYDDQFKTRRIYTAWDNLKDEERLFAGLNNLVRHGVKPDHIMVYILCGYWPGETQEDREYRRRKLREFGARPYPMPYIRTPEIVGFQRWVVGAYDKGIPWEQWVAAKYQPANLGQWVCYPCGKHNRAGVAFCVDCGKSEFITLEDLNDVLAM
jgi:hypothetical protein